MNIRPIDAFKFEVWKVLHQAYRQIMPMLNDSEEINEFQGLYWKLRPLVEMDHSIIGGPGLQRIYDIEEVKEIENKPKEEDSSEANESDEDELINSFHSSHHEG